MADDDDEWQFSIDEVGPDDTADGASDIDSVTGADEDEGGHSVEMVGTDDDGPTFGVTTADPDDDGSGNVAGELRPDAPVEAGTPKLENVAFATAGAILTTVVFAGILVPLDPVTIVGIAGAISGVSGLLYALFLRF